MKGKWTVLVSVLLVLSMLLGACAPKPTPTPTPTPKPAVKPTEAPPTPVPPTPKPVEPIKIAILGPLTGDVATFGASNRDGAIMAFEEWNAKGGVLGRPIEWVLGDSQCDPKAAADAARKVIDEDKVKYIVGAVCSSESIPISEYANEKKVLQISGTSTNPLVTVDKDGKVKPYTFRACFIDPFQGSVMAQFALQNLKAKTAAVVLDVGNDYIRGLAEFFRDAFEKGGGKVVVWESFVKEDTDFSAILAKVKAANPDVFFIPTYYDKLNLIAAQAKQKGITAVLLGGDGWDSPDTDLAACDGGYFSNHYSPDDPRPIVQDFVKRYQARFGKVPDALAALAYDAANILLASIEKAGVDDPTAVAKVMETMKFDAVSGTITFDKNHNPVKNAAILHVKDGKVLFEASVSPGAPPPAAGGPPIKIAILGPLTGDVATFGASNRDGAIMAFEEWNAKGGVLGRPIEWVLGDSQCDPKAAADAGKKVIDEDQVKYIVGAVCSSESIPISEYANQKKVVQISGTSTNVMVTVDKDGKVKPYTFRACFIDPFQGSVMAKFALENLKAKTAAVVLDVGNDYIKGLAEEFRKAFEAGGGKVVVWESFVKEDTDFSAILAKVKAANPDVFYIPTYYDKLNLIAAQAKQKGITAVLLGGDGWDSPDTDLAACDGGYYTNHYSPDDPRPIVQDFVKRYQARFGKVPDALAALAYDAANILLASIEKAGVDDPTAVAKAMETIKFEAVSGTITFDQFHNPVKNAAILHVKDGKVLFEASVSP